MDWTEVRCQRERDGQVCNNLIGYHALRDGHVCFWCRKCKRWVLISMASSLPPALPEAMKEDKAER